MKQVQIRSAIYSALVCLLLSLNIAAQDFRKTYEVGQGSTINVRNVSGDVTVTGYEGETVLVLGFKEGRDRDLVQVEDNSAGNNVDVRARYPENCDCNASIRFEVKVPRGNYKFDAISSTSGDVEVTGVSGDLRARSTSGRRYGPGRQRRGHRLLHQRQRLRRRDQRHGERQIHQRKRRSRDRSNSAAPATWNSLRPAATSASNCHPTSTPM